MLFLIFAHSFNFFEMYKKLLNDFLFFFLASKKDFIETTYKLHKTSKTEWGQIAKKQGLQNYMRAPIWQEHEG